LGRNIFLDSAGLKARRYVCQVEAGL